MERPKTLVGTTQQDLSFQIFHFQLQATSKKRRCVSAILKKFSRRRVVAPIKLRRPVVLPGTSKETAPVTTEVVPENADSAPSARGQKEPPVEMMKLLHY